MKRKLIIFWAIFIAFFLIISYVNARAWGGGSSSSSWSGGPIWMLIWVAYLLFYSIKREKILKKQKRI